MYSTGEYFPDRTVVHKNTTYVPNPAGTILHESRARTPSTAVVYDPAIPTTTATATSTRTPTATGNHVDSHARAGRKKRLSPEELREIHDLGYARGVDVYQESPIDEFALARPKGMHGRMRKMTGKTKKVLGSVTGNPLKQAVGQQQAAMGEAEVEAAREYKRHQAELSRGHAAGVSPAVAYGSEYDRYGATGGRMIEPGFAGVGYGGGQATTADFATDRTIAYSEFPRRGIEHHTGTGAGYAPVHAGYTSTVAPVTAPTGRTEAAYHEEHVEERRMNDADESRRRHRRHNGDRRSSRRTRDDYGDFQEQGYHGGAARSSGGSRQTQVYL